MTPLAIGRAGEFSSLDRCRTGNSSDEKEAIEIRKIGGDPEGAERSGQPGSGSLIFLVAGE